MMLSWKKENQLGGLNIFNLIKNKIYKKKD